MILWQAAAVGSDVEDKPKAIVTKQTWTEVPFIIRGKNRGRPAWHCILVPHKKIGRLKSQWKRGSIDIDQFGHVIEYLNHEDITKQMSGWGENPPKQLREWLDKHYGM